MKRSPEISLFLFLDLTKELVGTLLERVSQGSDVKNYGNVDNTFEIYTLVRIIQRFMGIFDNQVI